jgi:ABC-type multidrug transport system permease subunit
METSDNKLSVAGWVAIAVLLALLVAAIWYAVQVWISMSGVHMSVWGWTFLVLGVVVTTGLGAGLMALVFYSSRHDMDR